MSVDGKRCWPTSLDFRARVSHALFNKKMVISLEADSVAYISDTAKRFLKSLAENLEANHPKVVQNKGLHVFKKAVKGCFHTFGKKYRRQCLLGRS